MKNFQIIMISIFLIGCHKKDSESITKHEIANVVLKVMDSDRNESKYIRSDTIIFRDYVMDPHAGGVFGLEINDSDTVFHFNGWSSSIKKFQNYFSPNDVQLLKQYDNNCLDAKWDSSLLITVNIADRSYYNRELQKAPDYDLWYRIHTNNIDYVIISDPIIYHEETKAVVGMSVYLKDFYIQEILSLKRNKSESWFLTSRLITINRMNIDKDYSKDSVWFNMTFIDEIEINSKK